jgi:hypothetical protein
VDRTGHNDIAGRIHLVVVLGIKATDPAREAIIAAVVKKT